MFQIFERPFYVILVIFPNADAILLSSFENKSRNSIQTRVPWLNRPRVWLSL